MSDLFLEVLNASLAASWVVLAVVLARLVLKKAPRSLVCGLWSLVGLRLVFRGILKAPFSLIPSAQTIPPESLFDQTPTIDSGVPIIDQLVNPVYTESFRANPAASVNPLQIWTAISANIWLLGMIVMTLWALVSWLRIRRSVRESVRDGDAYLCDRIDSPFIFGLFRPRVYLPSDLDEGARAHVIAHEQAHLARRDHWWKPLGFLLLTVNWFNPAMWLAYILLCRDIELACDERVIRTLDAGQKKDYSRALLSCSISRRQIAACPLAFGEVGVKARVKSVLHYKKPAFWVIVLAAALTIVLAACLLTTSESGPAEIRWNGVLYIQEGDPIDHIPDKQQSSDSLRSVLHDSTPHPTEDGQAVRLGWEYAGQPFVTVGNALYLGQPGGGSWLPFRMRTPEGLLTELLNGATVSSITVRSGGIVETEELIGDRGIAMSMVLDELRHEMLRPGSVGGEFVLSVSVTRSGEKEPALILNRDSGGAWELVTNDPDYGDSHWLFSCEALEAQIGRYLSRAQIDDAVYDDPVEIDYQTFTTDDIALRVGLPAGWEAEEIGGSGYFGFRFRDKQMHDGWVSVKYWPDRITLIDSAGTVEKRTFRNGLTAQVFYSKITGDWDMVYFYGDDCCMSVEKPDSYYWDDIYHDETMRVLGSITVFDGGKSVFTPSDLGIHLRVENVSPNGLTLVCTQDGTPWKEILTGSPWSLEQWTEEGWVNALPETITWTMAAYTVPQSEVTRWNINWSLICGSLEPGTYRIGKHFTATPVPPPWRYVDGDEVEETVYAKFTIE